MENKNHGFTRKIARHLVETAAAPTPSQYYQHAKLGVLDWIAVTIGAKDEPLVQKLIRQSAVLGGADHATLIGVGEKKSVAQAALINGAMSHALDYDDNLPIFMGHPTVTLLPAIFAVAEWKNLSGRAVLDAYLAGLHTGSWVAQSTGVTHYGIGFHGTATMGRQASTAACAQLLGLDEDATVYALGIAGTLANGLKQSFGTMCKPLHAGVAAEGGVLAAMLAADGFDSAQDIYEGPLGFMATHHGENKEVDADFLDGKHPVELLEFKFHAACFCVHGAINAAQELLNAEQITVDEIEGIDVGISQISIDNAGKTELKTGLDGKFSTSYSVANAIITGDTGPEGYTDDAVRNAEVLRLMDRTSVYVDNELSVAEVLKCSVSMKLKNGRTVEAVCDPSADIPGLEEKTEKLNEKFFGICEPILGASKAKLLRERIDTLDSDAPIADLMELVAVD